MTNQEYFAHPALSASKIKQILSNPYDFFNGIEKPSSESMDFGTMVHSLVLESDLKKLDNGQKIVVEPKFQDLRTKAGKEAKEKFYTENANNFVVSAEAYECAKNVLNSELGEFFKFKGIREKPYFAEVLGREFKCKPDFFLENYNYGGEKINLCIDLKTCNDNTERGFTQSVVNYGYHIQAYIYSQILKADSFFFITIEKTSNTIACYYLDSEWFERAEVDIKRAFEILDNKDVYNKKLRVFKDENNITSIIQKLDMPSYLKFAI